jgi:hypothetical protein
MLKYLVLLCLMIGATVYVTRHDKRAAQDRAEKATHLGKEALAAEANEDHSQQYIEEAKRDAPSWFSFFRWPDGTTACAVILTLLVIAEQTNETRKAAIATQAAASASLKQVGLMEIQNKTVQDKERARLSIVFPPLSNPRQWTLTFQEADSDEQMCFVNVGIEVINHGDTKAFNVRASGYAQCGSFQLGEIIPSHGIDLKIPDVIGQVTVDSPIEVPIASSTFGDGVMMTVEDWNKVDGGKEPLLVIGTISYDDVFGNLRTTPFHLEWRVHPEDEGWNDMVENAGWKRHSSAST